MRAAAAAPSMLLISSCATIRLFERTRSRVEQAASCTTAARPRDGGCTASLRRLRHECLHTAATVAPPLPLELLQQRLGRQPGRRLPVIYRRPVERGLAAQQQHDAHAAVVADDGHISAVPPSSVRMSRKRRQAPGNTWRNCVPNCSDEFHLRQQAASDRPRQRREQGPSGPNGVCLGAADHGGVFHYVR